MTSNKHLDVKHNMTSDPSFRSLNIISFVVNGRMVSTA
jgi:hypothetical protein